VHIFAKRTFGLSGARRFLAVHSEFRFSGSIAGAASMLPRVQDLRKSRNMPFMRIESGGVPGLKEDKY